MIDDFKTVDDRNESLHGPTKEQAARQKITREADFHTPEQIAASGPDPVDEAAPKKPITSKRRFVLTWPPSKKTLIIGIVIILVIVGGVTAWALSRSPSKPVSRVTHASTVKTVATVPTTVASDLSGLPVSPSVNGTPVTAVMIENSTFARPQAGLSQAGVVFEAVAEGGVTRFMALYQDTAPNNVGPIRSLRPYYLSWAMGFDAAVAHVGGSPEALADVKSWGSRDLDEFSNGSSYHRITTREAPHNVYTAIATLNQLETSKGYTSSTFTSWPRKAAAPAKTPTAGTINLTLSGSTYNVLYTYDASTDSYNRSEGGAVQTDSNTGTQLSPKVVIAIVVPETPGALDASNAYYSDYTVIGSGQADVFQDGTETTGQWTKTSNSSQITFTASAGQPIKLNAGQTWITAVTSASAISYTP